MADQRGDELLVEDRNEKFRIRFVEVELDLAMDFGGGTAALRVDFGTEILAEQQNVTRAVGEPEEALVRLIGTGDAGHRTLDELQIGTLRERAPRGRAQVAQCASDGVDLGLRGGGRVAGPAKRGAEKFGLLHQPFPAEHMAQPQWREGAKLGRFAEGAGL